MDNKITELQDTENNVIEDTKNNVIEDAENNVIEDVENKVVDSVMTNETTSEVVEGTLNLIGTLKDTIKQDFVKTLVGMVNEFDLVFEYVDKVTIKKLKTYIKKLQNDNVFYTTETTRFIKDMESHADILYKINVGDIKLKTQHFDFLNNVVLFDGILDFSLFKEENKNTKKTLVNYLYTMYMSSNIINLDFNNVDSVDSLTSQLHAFVDQMKERTEKESENNTKQIPKTTKKTQSENSDGNINDIFGSLLGNKDIMNIASDMAKDLQTQNINPMSLMSSLLTGKVDNRLNSIINKISTKLEEKVNTGEINKDALEQQASNLLNMVGNNSNMTAGLPMLQTLLNNNKFK